MGRRAGETRVWGGCTRRGQGEGTVCGGHRKGFGQGRGSREGSEGGAGSPPSLTRRKGLVSKMLPSPPGLSFLSFKMGLGIPWRSSGKDSALSLPRVRVQSLVRELKSHKPRSEAKKS